MKSLISFFTILCFINNVSGQSPRALLTELGLKGPVRQVIEYEYRGGINQTSVDTSTKSFKNVMKFDSLGNELEELRYDNNGKLEDKFTFEYKPTDSTIIKKQFFNDKLVCTYVFKYNGKGYETEFDTKLEQFGRLKAGEDDMTFKYDDRGNIIRDDQFVLPLNAITYSNTYTYNKNNQKIESKAYDHGKWTSKTVYTYDSSGRIIKTEVYDASGKITGRRNTKYVGVDQYGNWLLIIKVDQGHSSMQGDYSFKNYTKRVITFY